MFRVHGFWLPMFFHSWHCLHRIPCMLAGVGDGLVITCSYYPAGSLWSSHKIVVLEQGLDWTSNGGHTLTRSLPW